MAKRKIMILVLSFCYFVCFLPDISFSSKSETKNESTFVLPASLLVIEDEAFSDTAAESVILPKGFHQIGDKAFDGMSNLSDVFIPDTTELIADSAFFITENLTIHGINDSYAEDWASEREIPFIVDDIWNVVDLGVGFHNECIDLIWRNFEALFILIFALYRCGNNLARSKRPQDRPELNPIDYCFP